MMRGMLNGQAWTSGTFPLTQTQASEDALGVILAAGPLWFVSAPLSADADGTVLVDAPAVVGTTITQATASKRPLLNHSGPNGLPVMEFDGVGDCLQMADDLTGTSSAVFASGMTNAAGAGAGLVEYTDAYFAAAGGVAVAISAQEPFIGIGGSSLFTFRQGSTALGSQICVVGGCFDRSTDTDTCVMHVNGSLVSAFSASADANTTGNFGSNSWNLGSRANGASLPLDGPLCEAVAYDNNPGPGGAVAIQCAMRVRAKVL